MPNFIATRIFLAQGRKNNFHSIINFISTTFRYLRAVSKLKPANIEFAFIIGEPDIRKILYGHWDIGRTTGDILSSTNSLNASQSQIDQLCYKIKLFLLITDFLKCKPSLVIGSGTPNPEMIDACLLFNKKLATICEEMGCLFFDPQYHAVSKSKKLLSKFLGYSVFNPSQLDDTHLSEAIGLHLDKFLQEFYTQKIMNENNTWLTSTEFANNFVEVKDFKTFKMKDLWFIAGLKKCKRYLSGFNK